MELMEPLLTLIYPFSPSITQQLEQRQGEIAMMDDTLKMTLIIIFVSIILLMLLIKVVYFFLYLDVFKKTPSFNPFIFFSFMVMMMVCFIPTEEDMRIELKEEYLSKHAVSIDTTISKWLDDNDIPQYKICNESAIYTYGTGMDMAEYKTKDTLLCGGSSPVREFNILERTISINVKDDGIHGRID